MPTGRLKQFVRDRLLPGAKEFAVSPKMKSLLKSRRFWASLAGVIVVLTGGLGLALDPLVVEQVVLLIGAWVIGDSLTKTE